MVKMTSDETAGGVGFLFFINRVGAEKKEMT